MDGTEMMSMYDTKPAKRVYLYKNGKTDSQPKCMVVNDRQVRDFSTFLNRVTSGLRAPVAIRNIYTPAGGHKVKKLNDLESGRYYVAGGTEQFKKVKYGSEPKRLLARRTLRNEVVLPPKHFHHTIVASARYKKPREKPYIIHVFRNGDETYCGVRILIPPRIIGSWEHVLELVTEKSHLYTPANRLCTLDGHLLHAVSELQDGGKYVALERGKLFQKVAYCAMEEKKSPFRGAVTLPRIGTKLHRRHHPLHTVKQAQEVGTIDTNTTPLLTASLKRQRRKSRPFAGRKNKEGREKAVEDHRADSIFGGSPVRVISPAEFQSTSQGNQLLIATTNQAAKTLDTPVGSTFTLDTEPARRSGPVTLAHPTDDASTADEKKVTEEIDSFLPENQLPGNGPTSVFHTGNKRQESVQATEEYVEDTSGEIVFKAKTPRSESYEAKEILESGDTEVEKPLELEEAREVAEEVDEPHDDEMVNKQTPQAVKELESQPLQTSIDLSLQRTKLKDTTAGSNPLVRSIDKADAATSKASPTGITTVEGAHVKSNHDSRASPRMESRPISVTEQSFSLTQILLNITVPPTRAAGERTPSPEPLTSNQEEITEGDRVESLIKMGDDSEKEVFDTSAHSALAFEDQLFKFMVEDTTTAKVQKTVSKAHPNSSEDKQPDSSNKDKDDIIEELHQDNTASTSHQIKADGTETSADATFVIEDTHKET